VTVFSVDELLADARQRIERVEPEDLALWRVAGALVVDIRPEGQRAHEGEFDHAIKVERNVLEWRFDLLGQHSLGEIDGYTQPIVVACSEGYASSFAAASLRSLGYTHVADLSGGYRAWRAWRDTTSVHT
jgi:rhodanese-related sulfurtransferase